MGKPGDVMEILVVGVDDAQRIGDVESVDPVLRKPRRCQGPRLERCGRPLDGLLGIRGPHPFDRTATSSVPPRVNFPRLRLSFRLNPLLHRLVDVGCTIDGDRREAPLDRCDNRLL